jgi:cytochrome P450
MAPFTFSDGLRVPTSDWVCIPQQAMMHDARIYPEPSSFDPGRFLHHSRADATGAAKAERRHLTDVSSKWAVWGLGNAAW